MMPRHAGPQARIFPRKELQNGTASWKLPLPFDERETRPGFEEKVMQFMLGM